MKLVSPKTLLASLLGCAFVVIKVMRFDGFPDLFWIIFIGYMSIKGLVTAFSQEAYDEDVKQAQYGKVFYSDLFGRFAYIASDIPIILILLADLLAAICPVTTLLRAFLIVLLLAALGYAVWFTWYVCKQKRLRTENGAWETGTLSEVEAAAWKRSERWHGVGLGIIVVLAVLYMIFGNPMIYMNNAKLEEALTGITSDNVTLEEVVPFEWTSVYTFDPYTSIDRIKRVTGSKSPALKESVSEGMTNIVFTNRGRTVASVCAYPSSIGYSLSFAGGKNTYYDYPDGGYSHIEYGDETVFEVTKENDLIRLYAYIDE